MDEPVLQLWRWSCYGGGNADGDSEYSGRVLIEGLGYRAEGLMIDRVWNVRTNGRISDALYKDLQRNHLHRGLAVCTYRLWCTIMISCHCRAICIRRDPCSKPVS